jgi:hypothetical protein
MSFLVLDIETRVDKALIGSTQFPGEGLSDEAAFERFRAQLSDESGGRSDFVPLSYHVPISIGLGSVRSDHVLESVDVLKADEGGGEEGIVRAFWERLETFDGTLVSFNGRAFDLPVLELQALRHEIAAPKYFGERNGLRTRYGRHFDLYEFLTNAGAVRIRGGLGLLSRLAALPGKTDIRGASVQALWEEGRFQDIHAYCRRDVISTYFLFLRVERLRGALPGERRREIEAATSGFRAELG